MYTNAHSSVGALIVLALPHNIPLALGLAFLSHIPLDFINESGYSTPTRTKIIEGGFLLSLIIIAMLTHNYWILFGAVSANLMDIVDKTLQTHRHKAIFPCHTIWEGKFIYQLGPKTQMIVQLALAKLVIFACLVSKI